MDKLSNSIAFAKQFLIAPTTYKLEQLTGWNVQGLGRGFSLYAQPLLNVTRASSPNINLYGLGIFLDPYTPAANDAAILQNLAADCASFSDLETQMGSLAGRWVLLATIGGETRVYLDATGQKTVFICTHDRIVVCSHPALLHHLALAAVDHKLKATFETYRNSGSWPVKILPYENVEQLLPNHYLSLPSGRMTRYWPRQAIPGKSLEHAAHEMLFLLRGTIMAALHRRPCIISLSGGYDSRVALAASAPVWHRINFFTLRRACMAHYDFTIPKSLKKKFQFKHRFLNVDTKTDPHIVERLHRNVGGMYYDRAAQASTTIQRFSGGRLHLPGTISEVSRCYYYPTGEHPTRVSPKALAKRAGFPGNPLAEAGFSRWLDELPPDFFIEVLDLFYWEHRLGVWAACGLTFSDGIDDTVPPMNCRRFLEAGLATSVQDRKAPYALMRQIIAQAKPELLDFRFNEDWVDDWHRFRLYKLPIPWRAKQALGWAK